MKTLFLAFPLACLTLTATALACGPDGDAHSQSETRIRPSNIQAEVGVDRYTSGDGATQSQDSADPDDLPYVNAETSGG